MTSSITNRQLAFMLFLTLTQYSVVNISKSLAESAGTGSWITIIITAVIFAIVAHVLLTSKPLFTSSAFDYIEHMFLCQWYDQLIFGGWTYGVWR